MVYTKKLMTSLFGIDIEEISRFSKKKFSNNESFYNKIFTKSEIDYSLKKSNPYPHFTARFCAKEATIKALNNKISYKEIEVIMKNKKPMINLPNKKTAMVSISHTKNYAVVLVVL